MNLLFFKFAILFLGVFYEAAANVAHHPSHRHHRHINEASCITFYAGILCADQEIYPFRGVSDVVNEVREILSSRPVDEARLRELDPEVYNYHVEPQEIEIQNLPEDVGDCKTEVQEFNPLQAQFLRSLGERENFVIVNIPSLRQSIVSVRCNCDNSVNRGHYRQVYREEKLLALNGNKQTYSVRDFSIQKFLIPYGCAHVSN